MRCNLTASRCPWMWYFHKQFVVNNHHTNMRGCYRLCQIMVHWYVLLNGLGAFLYGFLLLGHFRGEQHLGLCIQILWLSLFCLCPYALWPCSSSWCTRNPRCPVIRISFSLLKFYLVMDNLNKTSAIRALSYKFKSSSCCIKYSVEAVYQKLCFCTTLTFLDSVCSYKFLILWNHRLYVAYNWK